LAVIDVNALDRFINTINVARKCATPSCSGSLVCSSLRMEGMGGTVEVIYVCNGCGSHDTIFTGCELHKSIGKTTTIGASIMVAFIISGCLFATYYKAMKLALGINCYKHTAYMTMLKRLHPVVKGMLDEMCKDAKEEMKALDATKLGSWKQAVTSADGAWQTRGFHAKNGTFSVRNYMNGALLYYMHLCQRGSDDVIKEDVYKGTSKSMEGYAVRKMMKIAKDDGMNIAVQWQDSDASSSKHVKECFPDCKVMVCGGHAGKNHLKMLQSYSKMKCASQEFIKLHVKKFPEISSVTCHCKGNHKQGCGCLSVAFIQQARNLFSYILKDSQSAVDFAKILKYLPKHARNIHEWEENGTKQCCMFHPLQICSCGNCKRGEVLSCDGKDYTTKYQLTCEFHSLMYEIECDKRASMADRLIHPIFKRGHSNWLEASHSVMIRFRSKDVSLQRLHYEVSTNLALLQSNMTYMWDKKGKEYHWIPDLYKRLGLPLYEGMKEAYAKVNAQRKRGLERAQQPKAKRRRIQLYQLRPQESVRRIKWSAKHGGDSYDASGCGDVSKAWKKKILKNKKSEKTKKPANEEIIDTQDTDNPVGSSSDDDSSEDESDADEDFNEDDIYYNIEDDLPCICGYNVTRGHKRDCPQNFIHRGNKNTTVKKPKTHCICKSEETDFMVHCDGKGCSIGWFHYGCVGLSEAPETEYWFCDDCVEEMARVSPVLSVHTIESDGKDGVEGTDDSDEDSFVPDGKEHCTCRGEDSRDMVGCDGPKCAIKWFHFKCVGLSDPPTTKKWYCSACSEKREGKKSKGKKNKTIITPDDSCTVTNDDSCTVTDDDSCIVTNETQAEIVTVSGPLPTEEWKCTAVEYMKTWSKMKVAQHSQLTRPVTCKLIAPHVRDSVIGDGNCLFRAISKGVSGTEANHVALRNAMVNFMTHKDNAFSCAVSMCSDSKLLTQPIDAMKSYIKKNKMDKTGWGTDKEIHFIASMLQICIVVSGQHGSVGNTERGWVRYEPLFHNSSCMDQSTYKIYIFHNANHYDHVVPQLD